MQFFKTFSQLNSLVQIIDYLKQNLARFFLICTICSLLFSCTDSGCIDADDFGEYESETITVTANASQDNCSYDSSLDLTDSSQGSGVKSCFTQGATTVYDETGVTQNSSSGCVGFTDLKFRSLCVNQCVQSCLSGSGGAVSASAEPAWNSTNKKGSNQNSGVTIRPGDQIMLRAVGSISLGNSVDYPDLYVKANNPLPHSNKATWQGAFFDVRAGQALTLNFSGLTYLGANSTNPVGQTGNEADLYNLSKSLVVYMIPHPEGYGGFDLTSSDENQGSKNVPLQPDPQVWQCTYSGNDQLQSSCGNGSYKNLYPNTSDSASNNAFPFSSSSKSAVLTRYGGVVRWNNDGLKGSDFDPFAEKSVSCNGSSGSCSNISSVSGNDGQILGDISAADMSIVNSFSDAYQVSLKSLTGDVGCNSSLNISVVDASENLLYNFNGVSISNSSWTSEPITLESGHKLIVRKAETYKYNGTGVSCGRVVGIRFLKLHDLTMDVSGFVRFTHLGGVSGTCNIKGRIVNPNGSHVDFAGAGSADFYEYPALSDPLNSLPVGYSTNGSATPSWAPLSADTTNQIFVRKGQKIRFYPESWNGTWTTTNALERKCGIGMVMKIEPRPALLCRGTASELVSNSECTPEVGSDGGLIGCKDTARECSDSSNTTYYCLHTQCLETISCTNPSDPQAANYTRSCKFSSGSETVADQQDSSTCTNYLSSIITNSGEISSARNKCKNCSEKKLENANKPAMRSVNGIRQCYDLENFRGKVANIPLSPTSISDVNNFLSSVAAKGATKLSGFNGVYGNIGAFNDSGATSTGGKKVYDVVSQFIASADSRVKLFMLDGSDFIGSSGSWISYSDNTNPSSNYSGTNGVKVGFKGSLDFKNGQWMEVMLCKETSDSSNICKSISRPADFSETAGQPKIIRINAPSNTLLSATPDLSTLGSNYAFDSSGNLYRTTNAGVPGDCTLAVQGYENGMGSTFYCHTYEYSADGADSDEVKKLRLTFKIIDPELGNCDYEAQNDGIKVSNPFYDSSNSSNISSVCAKTETPGDGSTNHPGTCKKQFYCANKYSNNAGQYYVNVKVKSKQNGSVSSVISAVIDPVIEVMDGKRDNPTTEEDESTMGQAERIYRALISDPRYQIILKVSLVVMFTFYGVGYLLGVSDLNHAEIFGRILKIGFIFLMVGETGWDWFEMFFVKFFKEGTDYLSFIMASAFDDSPEIKSAIESGDLYDKSVLFRSVDDVFNLFFSSAVQKKLSALLFASIFGWLYLLIIWWSFMAYVYAVANSVLLYLTAQVFISILFVVGPLFFIFLLFNQTKEMFDKWLSQLIGFSLQQIFLLITLSFFNMLMYEVIKMSLGYRVCWDEVWTMNLGITRISLMSFWTIASLPPRTNANSQVGNIGNPDGIPSIFTILFIWVIAKLMEQFIGFMTNMAAGLAGGLKASEMGSGIKAAGEFFDKNVIQPAQSAAWNNTAGRVTGYVGEKLFGNQGAKEKKAQYAKDKIAKDGISSAMDKAENKLKDSKEYGLLGSEKEKVEAIKNARKAAADEFAADNNISAKEMKRLMNDKGIKTSGDGTVFESAYEAYKNRGTISKSLNEKEIDTSVTSSQLKNSMKSMSADERKALQANYDAGNVKVSKSASDIAADVLSGDKKLSSVASDVAKSAISSATKTAGMSLNIAASAAAKSVLGMDIDVAKSSGEAMGLDKDYDEARKQLEDEGTIDRMSYGTQWSANKEDKEKIRQRAQQNREQRKGEKISTEAPSKNISAGLARESDHIEALEAIENSDSGNVVKTLKSSVASATKALKSINPGMPGFKNAAASRKQYREKSQQNQDSTADILERGIDQNIAENDSSVSELSAKRDTLMSSMTQAKSAVDSKKASIADLKKSYDEKKKAASSAKNEDDKKNLNKEAGEIYAKMNYEQRELDSSDEMKTYNKSTSEIHKIDAELKNREIAGSKYQDMKKNIQSAKDIVSSAKESAEKAKKPAPVQPRSKSHQELAKSNPEIMDKAGAIYDKLKQTAETSADGSKEKDEAQRGLNMYDAVVNVTENIKDVDAFVKKYDKPSEEEKKSENLQKQFDELKTVEDFDKFVKNNQGKSSPDKAFLEKEEADESLKKDKNPADNKGGGSGNRV